ncbi:hypothetical protein EV121DRAFT_274799, partial [Schizophyllum commune]
GLGDLRSSIPRAFGIKRSPFAHTDPSKVSDINTLAAHYRSSRIFTFVKGRAQDQKLTLDEFSAGINTVVHKGKFAEYVERTSIKGGAGIMDDMLRAAEQSALEDDMPLEPSMPVNPIVYTSDTGISIRSFANIFALGSRIMSLSVVRNEHYKKSNR